MRAWTDDWFVAAVPPRLDPTALPRVLSWADARRRGFSADAINRRAASGHWRRVLPRTYLTSDTFTWLDRLDAALTFAGDGALLSGASALKLAEVRAVARPESILVLVPPTNRTRSCGLVQVRRSFRAAAVEPAPGPRRATTARAVADEALSRTRLDDVRAIVAEVLRRGLCELDELSAELAAGPRANSAHLRRALAEAGAGAWSAPEARAARLLRRAKLPVFDQNARIALPGGRYYVADFLWRSRRAILEIDSQEFHIGPAAWRATMDRHLALTSLGYSVVHRPPSVLTEDPAGFIRDIAGWLAGRPVVRP